MSEALRPDETLISKAVEAGLSTQLENADALTVDVHTDLSKALQGQADAVSIKGQGVVAQDVRVQAMEVHTDSLALNVLKAVFGELKLDKPLDATAHMSFTEADLNRAVNAPTIASRIPSMVLTVDDEQITIVLEHPLVIELPEPNKITLKGKAMLHATRDDRRVNFEVTLVPRSDDHPVLLEAFRCHPNQGLSIAFVIALMKQFQALLELPYLEQEGMAFRIKHLAVQRGEITIETDARIHDLPST